MGSSPDGADQSARAVWHAIRELVASPSVVADEHRFMRQVDLTAGPVRALRALLAAGPQPMRILAECLGCDKSYVTGLVKPLLSKGLVTIEPHSSDGRVKIVALTPSGRALAQRAQQVHDMPPDALSALEPEDLEQLRSILERAG